MANGKWQMANKKGAACDVGLKVCARRHAGKSVPIRRSHHSSLQLHGCETGQRQDACSAAHKSGDIDRREPGRGAGGASRADFIFKTEIALKEARETRYWLRLIVAAELVTPTRMGDL